MAVKGKKYPEKTTINLAQKERKHRDLGAVVPTAVILAIAIAAFCKFGVINRLNAVSDAQAQAAVQEQLVLQLQEKTAGFEDVQEEYQSYSASQGAISASADPMKCLSLIETELLSRAQISELSIADSLMTVKFSGVTLNEISTIYQRLLSSDFVSNVQVYTAATNSEKNTKVTATMTIQLAVEGTAAGEGAAS